MGISNLEGEGMDSIKIELLDYEGGAKTADIRALDTFYFAEGEQVFTQIREVTAERLTNDLIYVIRKVGSIEKLQYLHPQDTRSFMRAVYVSLGVGYLLGKLHIEKQLGENYTFAGIEGSWNVPFEEAIKFLRSMVPLTRPEFDTLDHGLKFRAFTIARVFSLDVINKIKERYIKALKEGNRPADVMQFLDETLKKIGVHPDNPYWLEVHARNNFMSAYNAGRWVQIKQSKTVKYLVYNAILDERTTKLCKSLDGTVKPADDSFWEKFYPPNHHGCRSLATVVRREFAYIKELKPTPEEKVKEFLKKLNSDKRLKREYQFKGHPAKTLELIPKEVWERAQNYGINTEILEFNKNTKRLDEWLNLFKKANPPPDKKLPHHEKDWKKVFGYVPSQEEWLRMIEETKNNPDEVYHSANSKPEGVAIQNVLGKQFDGKWVALVIWKNGAETFHPVKDWAKFIEGRAKSWGLVKLK